MTLYMIKLENMYYSQHSREIYEYGIVNATLFASMDEAQKVLQQEKDSGAGAVRIVKVLLEEKELGAL